MFVSLGQVASTSVVVAAPAEERKPSSKTYTKSSTRKERSADKVSAKEPVVEKEEEPVVEKKEVVPESEPALKEDPVVALPPTTSSLGISFFYDETAVQEAQEETAEDLTTDPDNDVLHTTTDQCMLLLWL